MSAEISLRDWRRQARQERMARQFIRRTFGPLSRISLSLSALWAERLFRTPPRSRVSRREGGVLSEGKRSDLSTPQGRIAVWRWGDSPRTAVLLHGWGGHAGRLSTFVHPLLRAGFSVVAFDAPAHGDSAGRLATLVDFERALSAVGRAFGPVAGFVGHSVGATAGALAIRHGLRVPRAVLLAPAAVPEEFAARFAGILGIPPRVRDRMKRLLEDRYGARWPDLSIGTSGPPGAVSVLIFHDLKDKKVPFRDREAILKAWQDTRIVRTRGLGHHKILRDPDVVSRAVAFLSEHPGALLARSLRARWKLPASEHRIVLAERPRHSGPPRRKPPELSKKEKEDFIEQVEEFEGPDRREKRGKTRSPARTPGVSPS